MKEVVFTGFPGFIASQLMYKHAQQNKAISAIILSSERTKAEKEAKRIEKETNCRTIQLIEGDITISGLNLTKADKEYLQEKEVTFWHLAAIYDLAVPRDLAWKVNVEGTRHVNEFVSELPSVERYVYFSTAYVAGNRQGTIYEDQLQRPEAFKNFYEETKFEAELLVNEMKKQVPVTIIRPGIVRGHSITGETIKFDGPYFFLNLIDRVKFLPIIPFVGRSKSYLNVVPIDYILEASMYLSELAAAAGQTVHLTDPNPHPVEEIYRGMVHLMTGKNPKGRVPHSLAKMSLSIGFVRRGVGVEIETLDYLTWSADFDTQKAENLLAGSGIYCADFIATMPAMVEFYNVHKNDKKFQIAIR
ncbi:MULTISPECIES: SDR family oxidoreductase [Planococcus]|uniref:3-beta hydroxysteroid dehydrogenase n=1 Tax=Planococcus faecalis TaxID=1598147 RepID=A0ABN4XRT2_9BACL|nr:MULTISPECIES: SDR family oxidoreductase [Planococcus]AQU79989.1 3-beta hydroxysteroid dehydrogenase [Planococcus faecalis]MDJ0330645.1 SDR family oxidoreductase [Planococcus sp. S3-L1]OHX53595.1 3-beta hydroxysteroid dehydrogenase [Planococcus faecalis]